MYLSVIFNPLSRYWEDLFSLFYEAEKHSAMQTKGVCVNL